MDTSHYPTPPPGARYISCTEKGQVERFVLVDEDDYERVVAHNWQVTTRNGKSYAVHHFATWPTPRSGPRSKYVYMQRFIMGVVDDPGVEVDHKNGNGLDNRKQNLRNLPKGKNMQNQKAQSRSKSGFRGVRPEGKRWAAYARNLRLASFETPEAANAFLVAYRRQHMPYAVDDPAT